MSQFLFIYDILNAILSIFYILESFLTDSYLHNKIPKIFYKKLF